MALVERMCMFGGPFACSLALGGEEGVGYMAKSLLQDLELTLHLARVPYVDSASVDRSALTREDPL